MNMLYLHYPQQSKAVIITFFMILSIPLQLNANK